MKINQRVIIIRESIAKIVHMLSFRKIRVTQEGSQAYVRHDEKGVPVQLNIPFIPDDASDELLNAVQGFLDHEVGHLLFSDFGVLNEVCKRGDRHFQTLVNIIEDPFVERKMREKFPGSGQNINAVLNFLIDKKLRGAVKKAAAKGDKALMNVLLMPMMRALSGQRIFQDFMDEYGAVMAPVIERLGPDFPDMLRSIQSSSDTVRVAEEFVKRLASPPEEKPDESGEGDDKDKSKDDKSGKPEKSKSKKKSKPEPEGDEGEESKDDSPGGGEEEDEDIAPAASSAGASGDEGKDDEPQDLDAPAPKPEPTEEEGEAAREMLDALKELVDDFDKLMSDAIMEEAVTATEATPYKVWSKDHDVIEPIEVRAGFAADPRRAGALARMMEEVDHMVGPMQKDIERAIAARSAAVWTSGHRSGRLHGASLSRLAIDRDDVFRRKQDNRTKDVATELVVDASGSMSGTPVRTAAYAAYALSSVLDRLQMSHEVVAFTTRTLEDEALQRMREESHRTGIEYSRVEAVYMPIIKQFHERVGPVVRERFATLGNFFHGLENNIDGESVMYAYARLMQRPETRKVMIVLSDGRPMAQGNVRAQAQHLKAVVEQIERSGVDVIGIGIEDDSVRHFYKKHLVLERVAELPGAVMGRLKQLLTPI